MKSLIFKCYGIVGMVIITQIGISCFFIKFAVANPQKNVESLNSEKEEIVNAYVLQKMANEIKNNSNFDLSAVQKLLPQIVSSKSSSHYFESALPLTPADFNIHAKGIEILADALINNAVIAAQKKDWKRCQDTLTMTISLILLPMELKPPDEVLFLGAYKLPGSDLRDLQWRPAFSESIVFKPALEKIYAYSDKNKFIKQMKSSFDIYWEQSQDNRKAISTYYYQFKKAHGGDLSAVDSVSHTSEWNKLQDEEKNILLNGLTTLHHQIPKSFSSFLAEPVSK